VNVHCTLYRWEYNFYAYPKGYHIFFRAETETVSPRIWHRPACQTRLFRLECAWLPNSHVMSQTMPTSPLRSISIFRPIYIPISSSNYDSKRQPHCRGSRFRGTMREDAPCKVHSALCTALLPAHFPRAKHTHNPQKTVASPDPRSPISSSPDFNPCPQMTQSLTLRSSPKTKERRQLEKLARKWQWR